MGETIRSALWCVGICLGILVTAQMLRASGALSFLPENDIGKVAEVFGHAVLQEEWKDELIAVFGTK